MHLHSFTFDFHLSTIHSYISGQQLIFRHGYHIMSFLDDFIKYYQKSPSCARNIIYADNLAITNINLSASQLYNYIISHNKQYGMRVLRMVPVIQSADMDLDTEYALVETLRSFKVSYFDAADVRQVENFDVGLLIAHDTSVTEDQLDSNTLVLKYYIILTSQREPYPKSSNSPPTLGAFKPIRLAVNYPSGGMQSRKCSTTSNPSEEKCKLEDSGEHSDSSDKSRTQLSSSRGMCDEVVMYLGYVSSQEILMQQLLSEHVNSSKVHLEIIVEEAALNCRRDFLWNSLLPYNYKDESNNKEKTSNILNYGEFTELLNLVTIQPINEIDDDLTPFLNMHISWYRGLTKVIINKYANLHRYFISPDGNTYYVAVTHSKYHDFFMLLHINLHSSRADISLVLRELIANQENDLEKSSQYLYDMHCLIEDFVNVCCFHLWSGIM